MTKPITEADAKLAREIIASCTMLTPNEMMVAFSIVRRFNPELAMELLKKYPTLLETDWILLSNGTATPISEREIP